MSSPICLGLIKSWTRGRAVRRAVRVQMIQQQIQTARIQQRVVPGKKQMARAVRVAHHVKRQPRSVFGVQFAARD